MSNSLMTEQQKRQQAIRAEQDKKPLPTHRRRRGMGMAEKGSGWKWRGGATGDVERC